jgi:hypothetical protein
LPIFDFRISIFVFSFPEHSVTKRVKDYWPGNFERELKQTLAWLYSRQNAPWANWQGNARGTNTTPSLCQCGILSVSDLAGLAQTAVENIVFDVPPGMTEDLTTGPDGFPINYSPTLLPRGYIFLNTFQHTYTLTVTGRCFSLLQAASAYRVDFFVWTDEWYYKGSTALVDAGGGVATWSRQINFSGHPGALLAVLYPTSVSEPPGGWYGTSLPAGWKCHTNMGVGKKLTDYKARVYDLTDVEHLKEDDIPIIVQDRCHARAGSAKAYGSGTATIHIAWNDPEVGWRRVFNSLQQLAVIDDLPRSLEVPPSDPEWTPDTTSVKPFRVQNRNWIYDAALAIIAYAYAGNFLGALRILNRLEKHLDEQKYLAATTLENCEDGSIARWTKAGDPGAYLETFNDPLRIPYGGGKQMHFHAAAAGDNFTYIGPAVYGNGLPDSTDFVIQWQFRAAAAMTWQFEVSLTTEHNNVTRLKVTSGPAGDPTYDSGTKTITCPLGASENDYVFWKFDLKALCQQLASDTWTSTTGFKVLLNQAGELYLDNLSLGTYQPEGSLSFSYDVFYGLPDQFYVRTGAMAWLCYAYALYMELTADYTPAPTLKRMLDFILSLESSDPDLRQGLFYGGFGEYADPGYHYVPGPCAWCSTEHNIDLYFAFKRVAKILPVAANELLKRGLINGSQATALTALAATLNSKAENIKTKILANLYIAAGADPGHFAQGVDAEGELDTAIALDAAGSWTAIFCHEVGDDTKATECLKFIYQKLFLTNQQILKSSEPNSWNMAYEQLTLFDGFRPYGSGYDNPPASVWQEGTWGVINALLRCQDVAGVQSYFGSVEGSLDAFLTKLVRGQRPILSTTGDGSLLNYSLASRSLPYEFSVWAGISSTAWFWLTAWNPTLLLATETTWELRPYLKVPRGVEQNIRQLEGQGSIGALELEAVDGAGYLTGLASGGKLEGKKVTLKVGYPGLASADFVTLATQEIEAVKTTADLTGFVLTCRDLKRTTKSKVFQKGDDGFPISGDHPRTFSTNPMDICLIVLQNELGIGQVPGAPPSAWNIYDPSQWSGGSNPTLINPNSYLDIDGFLSYRNGIFAGYVFDFTFEEPVEAKQFLEFEIFKVLGGYLVVLADGRLSPRFFVPPHSLLDLFSFSDRNMTALPGVERESIINQVTYRMDYDGSEFRTELLFVYAPSMQQFGLAGAHTVESKGVRLARGGASLAGITAGRIFRRYGGIDPISGQAMGGAVVLNLTTHYMTLTVEVGDFVYVSHPRLPNFLTGERGVYNRVFEVIERQPNFTEGTMTYKLLDTSWMAAKKVSRTAPDGTPPWPEATPAQRERYMFVCAHATKQYSDGTAGKTIF